MVFLGPKLTARAYSSRPVKLSLKRINLDENIDVFSLRKQIGDSSQDAYLMFEDSQQFTSARAR
jgi:hypothetical protein